MSLKRTLFGAGLGGLASLPVSQAIADSTVPAYQKNQKPKFMRAGRIVDNPFYKKRKDRENIIKALGAITTGYAGAKKIPKGLKALSKKLGEREYGLAMKDIDSALEASLKARNDAIRKAKENPLMLKRYEKQFYETQRAEESLRQLKKDMSKKKFISHRDSQLLPIRGRGTSKELQKRLGVSSSALGSVFRRKGLDGKQIGELFNQKVRGMK